MSCITPSLEHKLIVHSYYISVILIRINYCVHCHSVACIFLDNHSSYIIERFLQVYKSFITISLVFSSSSIVFLPSFYLHFLGKCNWKFLLKPRELIDTNDCAIIKRKNKSNLSQMLFFLLNHDERT